jgi:hypothetical protein
MQSPKGPSDVLKAAPGETRIDAFARGGACVVGVLQSSALVLMAVLELLLLRVFSAEVQP